MNTSIQSTRTATVYAVALAAVGLFALWLTGKWLGDFDPKTIDGIKGYLIPLATVVLLTIGLKRQDTLSWTSGGRAKTGTIASGWYIILAALIVLAISFVTMPRTGTVTPTVANILFFAASCLLTGLFEEWLCRGLIQNVMLEGHLAEGRSPWRAIVLSSLIFALLHFANLLNHPELVIGTISQVGYTFALGILLGTSYYLTKSLISVALLHAIFNFIGSFSELFLPPAKAAAGDISLLSLAIQWGVLLPGIYVAYRIYKKHTTAMA